LGTVLVTGGAGIVGSFLVEKLVKDPACAKVVATYHSEKSYQHRCEGVEYHVCDITDPSDVKRLLDQTKPTIIIHTVSPGPDAPYEVQYKINYVTTKQLVEQATAHPTVQAFIYTSSSDTIAYRSGVKDRPLLEETCTIHDLDTKVGAGNYGRTKGASDRLVLAANTGRKSLAENGDYVGQLLTSTLRIAGLYGERDLKTIHTMLKLTNTSATKFQIGPDTAFHEWLFTDNAAQAHLLAAKALLDGKHTTPDTKVDGESFFITDDSPMPLWQFSRNVWRAAGDKAHSSKQPPSIIIIPFWLVIAVVGFIESFKRFFGITTSDMKLNKHRLQVMQAGSRLSPEKAKKRLGYRPLYNTEEGIKRSVAW
ncbi:NAD(P)-binding protein, partial [Aaosphaeria arxii CBS 175.79]